MKGQGRRSLDERGVLLVIFPYTFYGSGNSLSISGTPVLRYFGSVVRIPFTKGYRHTITCYLPTRRPRIGNRFELMSPFDMRSTPKFIKEPLIRIVNTHQFLLDRLTWQQIPMRVRGALQRLEVCIHRIIIRIRKPAISIPLTLPLVEVFMHLSHVVKQVAKTYRIRLMTQLIFIGFYRSSQFYPRSSG